MQINITRKDAGLSDSLKAYIEDKVGQLARHYGKIIDSQVLIDLQGKEHLVEINLRVSGHTLFAKDSGSNLRASLDSCVGKLEKQLHKLKGKIRRKALTPEEAVLSGKVNIGGMDEQEGEELTGPVLTLRPEETEMEPEQRTGT
ncbi:MAG: ribosome-associated translation inhibitor RaiA [Candidatus Glassbacteria bacterium]